jgi:RNA polymerase sigma-70 factor (ECF subfamily)
MSAQTSPGWDWARLRALALRETTAILGAGPRAEDATQEALLRAFRKADQCRGVRPDPWVRRIARAEARRSAVRPTASSLAASEASTDDSTSASHARVDARRALASLGAEQRRAVFLRYWLDMTQPQVAQALGVPEGTVKIRLHRARMSARNALGPRGW